IGKMGGQRRGAEGATLVPHHPRLHDDATGRAEQAAAAEAAAAPAEGRAAVAGRTSAWRRRSGMARLLCGPQHLVEEALRLRRACTFDAARPDTEIAVALAHDEAPDGGS